MSTLTTWPTAESGCKQEVSFAQVNGEASTQQTALMQDAEKVEFYAHAFSLNGFRLVSGQLLR
ncbi:hypothetical protein [Shewanella atlantica]|uniref:hypothetical protein n=1 Tax=Shewanella atlantica TaxID=271099 RepID=UPI0037360DDD